MERRAGRRRDAQTHTGIILFVILNWRVRAKRERETSRDGTGAFRIFHTDEVFGAKDGVACFFANVCFMRQCD